jgi:alkylation response protein AidB-like acyl-CoA dehydrogenase
VTTDPQILAELRGVARQLLADPAAREAAKGAADAPPALDWHLLAEAGWLGLEVSERCSGAGAGFAEVAVVLQEMGRALTRSGYLGFTVLAVAALDLLAPSLEIDQLLTAAAAGELRLAVALATGEAADPPFRVVGSGDEMCVVGQADFVPDASEADRLLLLTRDVTGEPVLVSVDREATGLSVVRQPILDQTRSVATVTASDLVISTSDRWHFRAAPEQSATLLRCRAALAIACDSFGVAEAMLDETVAYAKVRHQFGRPIGSFQGVKFACADMLVALRISAQLLAAAIEAVDAADPLTGGHEAEVAVARAKSFVCEEAVAIAGKALQFHGGMGYTWEAGIHVALKRAAFDRSWFGSPAAHRRRLAVHIIAEAQIPIK